MTLFFSGCNVKIFCLGITMMANYKPLNINLNGRNQTFQIVNHTFTEIELIALIRRSWPKYRGKLIVPRQIRDAEAIFKKTSENRYIVAINSKGQFVGKVGWGYYDNFIVDVGFFVVGGKHSQSWFSCADYRAIGIFSYLRQCLLNSVIPLSKKTRKNIVFIFRKEVKIESYPGFEFNKRSSEISNKYFDEILRKGRSWILYEPRENLT